MPEPTLRDIERHLMKLAKGQAEIDQNLLSVKADIAKVAAEQGGIKIIAATLDELTAAVDHLVAKFDAGNQIISGLRSQGNSSFDIATALSRRFRKLIQRLTEKGVIAVESLREDELETEGEHAEQRRDEEATAPAE